ncbi:UDP-glucoronosyl and UDP-glucosyl transferase [Ancylostoma caninum]|uniref:UDP-glucuronosyltransferase n=1 Tax=Ancylostoma caninum TaxID=29170 RepID=A0A368FCG4_ANCCA|nr:UDP-glucoronosyl and UDP-glucosyl transferase [Ancylostoma caninum]
MRNSFCFCFSFYIAVLQEFQRIVDRAEGIVVFSFGSVTPSEKMPGSWKLAFIDAFKRFPNYHFIWRYVGTDLQGELPPNVHVFKWLPQSDLLQNPKIKAFITHGGYNSVQESISAGVPLITIPLFGDQPKNALLAERHRFAVTIHKSDLSADVIAKALDTILTDHSFSRNVERLSRMVRKQPVSAAHLIVSWAEFVAEFRTLDNLVPAGTKLNFIQYHSLDVITFLLSAFAFVLFVIYKLLKFIILKLCSVIYRKRKQKNE